MATLCSTDAGVDGWVTLTLIPPVTRLKCIVWVLRPSLFLGSIDARTWRGYRLYGPRPPDGPHWQFQSGDGAAYTHTDWWSVNKKLKTNYNAYGKQGVALTGRNSTGPPSRAAPWWVRLHMRRCYRRRQTPETKTILPPTPCVGGPVITCIHHLYKTSRVTINICDANNSFHEAVHKLQTIMVFTTLVLAGSGKLEPCLIPHELVS